MNIAVYPGSFDPITKGHLDIIERGAKIFDKVVVAVLINIDKKHLFTIEERVHLINKVTSHIDNVEVVSFDGLLVNFLREREINVIMKGIRTVLDFEYELQMANVNKELNNDVETVCLMAAPKYSHISSSNVKQVAQFGGNIENLVPEEILEDIMEKIRQ